MNEKKPIFVKIDEYQDILEIVKLIKGKVEEANGLLNEIHALKNQEEEELEIWKTKLGDVEEKIRYIDNTMFKP